MHVTSSYVNKKYEEKTKCCFYFVWFEDRVTVQHMYVCVTKMRFACVCVCSHENTSIMSVPPKHTQRERGSNYLDTGGRHPFTPTHTLFSPFSFILCEGKKWYRPWEAYFKKKYPLCNYPEEKTLLPHL